MSQPPTGAVPPWLRQGAERTVAAAPGAVPASPAPKPAATVAAADDVDAVAAVTAAPAKKKKATYGSVSGNMRAIIGIVISLGIILLWCVIGIMWVIQK